MKLRRKILGYDEAAALSDCRFDRAFVRVQSDMMAALAAVIEAGFGDMSFDDILAVREAGAPVELMETSVTVDALLGEYFALRAVLEPAMPG